MKWFCFLLAAFFLCLDLEPCKDSVGVALAGLSFEAADHSHTSKPYQDQCPPMCHCGCCNMQVVFNKSIIIRPLQITVAPKITAFIPQKPVTRPTNIWQPPKLNA
ncbi:DUF6660 family protein [Mucilaginibacter sp. PAMB04274]|uniref:DUF6660 family protein n=1 Tax=Mucilaginibacter sp. PAMB04274 TaxID=3138568 RepID=UPI00332D86E1